MDPSASAILPSKSEVMACNMSVPSARDERSASLTCHSPLRTIEVNERVLPWLSVTVINTGRASSTLCTSPANKAFPDSKELSTPSASMTWTVTVASVSLYFSSLAITGLPARSVTCASKINGPSTKEERSVSSKFH